MPQEMSNFLARKMAEHPERTLTEEAARVGVGISTLTAWRNGRHFPGKRYWPRLLAAYPDELTFKRLARWQSRFVAIEAEHHRGDPNRGP